jgi:phosphomannomutase/phosphoglucomutase
MVLKLAAAVGSYFGGEIAIGRDGRTTSPMFRDAAVSGLISVGCKIRDAGMLPTPALQYAVKSGGFSGGVMITASHNPPEFNGLKVIAGDGVEASRVQETEIEGIFFGEGPEPSPWDGVGSIGRFEALTPYKEAVLSHVDLKVIRGARLGVALDPGNGVTALSAPMIASELGSGVFTINVEVDGRFPNRVSEPKPDNLGGLQRLVRSSGADLGVAFDGDGDRSIFVDERGEVHWGDRIFALLAREFVNQNLGARVASAVNSSQALHEVVEAAGGSIVWTRVGSVVISRTMVDKGIMFGGEENGGIMYGPHLQVRDGSMAMALVMEVMAKTGKPLSELISELPQYSQMKTKIACPEELKPEVLEALRGRVEAPKVDTIDGIKLVYDDRSWILFRPSGTEPIYRIYAEAKSQDRVEELIEEHSALIESVVDSLKNPS